MTSHESELISPSTTDSPTQAGDISPKSHHSPTGTVFESEAPVEQKVEPPAIVDEQFQVHLEGLEDPKNLPSSRKWLATLVICSAACCVTCVSSVAAFTQKAQQKEFHVSSPVTILGISLYVEGLGIGPLLLGPLSEFFGRNPVYWISYGLFFIFNIPVAVAPNIVVHLVFRFITGFCGAAFLSVAGGSVSDLFANQDVLLPMAVYSISPMIGPVLGPAISGFINQHLHWRWTYWVVTIWSAVELLMLMTLVPETYAPALESYKARRLRKSSGDNRWYSKLEKSDKGLWNTILVSCHKPFQIMLLEPMALALDIWASLLLGILYLTFQAFPTRVFGANRGFSTQLSGLAFCGIGVGMLFALVSQPFWIKVYKEQWIPFWEKSMIRDRAEQDAERAKHGDEKSALPIPQAEPESRLLIGMAGAILVPIGLFWFAFTTPSHIPWPIPMVATIPFGTGIVYAFISIWTFLVHAYRPFAASAMAGNSFMRSAFAAAFPLISSPMYNRLGTVGATAFLAGLSLLMTPLPFLFYHYGPRLRRHSRFALA